MIGRELAQYRLVERLGIGGMGEVFLADDTRLERQVAIKVLHPKTVAERERLLIEARAASALHHPAVAHVYEIGEADGIPFIAMEYVRGVSLSARIGGAPMPPTDIVNIAVQIADAMVEAHRKGVIHRDLKPANISGPLLILALCYEKKSDYANWAKQREEYSLENGNEDYASAIKEGFAAGGYGEANRRHLAALERRANGERPDPNDFFEVNVRLGNFDEAMKWAAEMVTQKNQTAFRLSGHPVADPLRDDPRFVALLQRMGLPNAGG